MERFDLLGPLPAPGSTTVLEASAGTGKTFALAGLVTRFISDGVGKLDEMLLITFSKAASRELRERVRCQIVEAVAALEGSLSDRATDLLTHLTAGTDAERGERCARLRDALSDFDAATICTTHQFCHLVLKSLGVAGDTDTDATLVESLDDLVGQIVDDLYLAHFGSQRDEVALSHRDALALARAIVEDPCAQLRLRDPDPQAIAGVRLRFATDVLDQLELRKRRLGIFSYNDLLNRLAGALKSRPGSADSAAADRMRRRWSIVMIDEFQDTDPIQWEVIDRAFNGHSRLVLIGDPKQAIYGFRGGDIYTYLRAAQTAGERRTLSVNWRSDKVLVDSLQTLLRGAALGDPDIVVRDIEAHVAGHRLRNAPHNQPFRLRVVGRAAFGCQQDRTISIDQLRRHIPADLAADVGALLASDATFDGNRVRAGDIAVIVESGKDARACQTALTQAGIPAVYTGDGDVFAAEAAKDWLFLLDAFDQTHRAGLVRAAAATVFFGKTAGDLAAGGDDLTDEVAATLREWSDELRNRGPAAVFEAAQLAGVGRRVLAEQAGERTMTDLAHIAQLLHAVAHRERLTLPALRDWLRRQCEERAGAPERSRRIDSDAAAVQILTVWGAKGLQFPIVYLPFAFNRHVFIDDIPLYHDEDGVRCLDVGGPGGADRRTIEAFSRAEAARNDIRLTYVALTRAQSQVVAWWAPAKDEPNGGLSRLLRGRRLGQAEVPDSCVPRTISDEDALACLRAWEAAGGPAIEEASVVDAPAVHRPAPSTELAVRHFHRSIDTAWRRTSYSALVRSAEESYDSGVSSEPEMSARDDEIDGAAVAVTPDAPPAGADVVSPMSGLPAGATFGSLVHAVLETADPFAADLAAELEAHVRRHSAWWPVDAEPTTVASALLPMHDTSLGPLAEGLTLRRIGLRDRLRELDFEIPLAGGDIRGSVPQLRLADVGALVREHLSVDDPLAGYSDRLMSDSLGGQSLRGYLSGSVDVVLRLPRQRYAVVDYKTNMLGATAADYGLHRLTEAMLHSDYPLQALLYTVVLHRFLRWRQPGYQPSQHLGGVLYLFVRGMCGPQTPTVDGHPCGVFSWLPPVSMVTAVSDLLDEGRA
ncbi:exodeoxyribonuclease V subunit beta [Mycobacterium sp. 852002-51057_SCH5723018]|uniref:exodeoxyribonuclease V subunit beta n=1 Tax=Mycobacterium sp. 852002-51057_SCH5723018 TaxID=1834094 RepID=UPI000801FEB3|nr:exodeoxyribonuclease V subunit beta [Mycobacterium sp. 852002-51057_SCH5723018]OBG28933.1 exodeoxyribonuclease V subunit beta [Mycobacterium sp. 852002-51057_SCH5723018]